MLIGEYIYSIDDKKRLSIPSRFRGELGKKAVITKGIDMCLVVYPLAVWKKEAGKLEKLPGQADPRRYARIMLSGAMDASLDKLGRILVPDYLKEYAKLQKNVAILGLSNRIEIWDEALWQEYKKKSESEVADMVERLKELGV